MDMIVGTKSDTPTEVVLSEPKSETTPDLVDSDSSLPPSLYEEAQRLPLVIDLLQAKEAYDTFNVKELSSEIDTHINAEIERRKLSDTEQSYKTLLDEMTEKLHLPDDATIWTKLEKLAQYLRVNKKMADAIAEKERLLTADPLTLEPEEMKRQWELVHG